MEQYAEAVASALAGNQEGYDFLYQSTYQKKFFIAKKYMGNDMDAQDVLQDAYVQAFTKLNTLQDYQKFPNWFGMIVANTAKNALQKKKMLFFSDLEGVNEEGEAMELNIMDTDASRQPEIAYTEKETQEMVHEMLDTLPDDQRMCILMFHFEGASIREIAEAMECSENTVKSRLNYGRKAIKKKSEELQKKGCKLYSMAPLPLLLFLLRKEEQAFLQNAGFVIPSAASVMNQGAKIAKQASKGFLKTVAGKVTMTVAGLAAIGSIGTGIFLGANALQEKRTAPTPAPEQQVQATATETPTATPEPTQTPVPIADRWRDAYRKILSKKLKVKGYTENGKTMLVNYLSAGYQSLLWMLMEISFRVALLNPEMADYSQAEGIVLIDEIDMHLHPRWQWKILDALHSSFPKVQFIAATHSPIIISSFRDAKLLSIGQNDVEELSGAYAYSIDDVVEYKQGSSGIPQELWQRKKEFEDAFYQRDKQNSQKALDGMKELFGEDNTEVKRAEAKMRMRKNWN